MSSEKPRTPSGGSAASGSSHSSKGSTSSSVAGVNSAANTLLDLRYGFNDQLLQSSSARVAQSDDSPRLQAGPSNGKISRNSNALHSQPEALGTLSATDRPQTPRSRGNADSACKSKVVKGIDAHDTKKKFPCRDCGS